MVDKVPIEYHEQNLGCFTGGEALAQLIMHNAFIPNLSQNIGKDTKRFQRWLCILTLLEQLVHIPLLDRYFD
jgi:hypothetical protein